MVFNSIDFIIFLTLAFSLYWFVFHHSLRGQNLFLVICSYIFYSWWDWRFLSLIIISTIIDYNVGLKIFKNNRIFVKKIYLWISIISNLLLLCTFKYFNFFIDSWLSVASTFGFKQSSITINLILPVGISFYTFQTISYSLDIYRGSIKPTKDFISFAAFICFFPQLVAGPIERARNLLPQMLKMRFFEYKTGVQGVRLIIWGMFKKIVIADSLAHHVDFIFTNYTTLNSLTLLLGLVYFSFQIYCDFSGYSDIAIGVAKLFGFELMSNFNFPFFSRDVGEFWRRWHISLSSWFRDYVYIPLGGSKRGKWISIRNIVIVFLLSGFWHGANWTFIVWGLCHAMLFLPLFLINKNRRYLSSNIAENSFLPSFFELLQMMTTYFSTTILWVFFRSQSIADSIDYLSRMVIDFSLPNSNRSGIPIILIFFSLEWIMRKSGSKNILCTESLYIKSVNVRFYKPIKFLILWLLLSAIFNFSIINNKSEFIYFQF